MSETTSISIDLETAALVEEIKKATRLSKSEIARQAFAMFKNSVSFKALAAISSPDAQYEPQLAEVNHD